MTPREAGRGLPELRDSYRCEEREGREEAAFRAGWFAHGPESEGVDEAWTVHCGRTGEDGDCQN